MKEFHDMSACPPANLPKDPADAEAILKVLVDAERCAVKGHAEICHLIAGKDHRLFQTLTDRQNNHCINKKTPYNSHNSEYVKLD